LSWGISLEGIRSQVAAPGQKCAAGEQICLQISLQSGLFREILRGKIRLLYDSLEKIPVCGGTVPVADENAFFCGCADYRASGVGNEDGSAGTFVDYMCRAFHAKGLVTPKDPTDADIEAAVALASQGEQIILGTCKGHLFLGQIALAQALARTGKPLTVVALRNPYDVPLLPRSCCRIAAYDYSTPSFMALEEIFRGGDEAAIAKFAETALKLAESGSREAQAILARGAGDLHELVYAVQKSLGIQGCTIVLLGGLLSSENPYRDQVVRKLSELGNVIAPANDALWGAAQMAWEMI
jgi:hypothetical protein